jgi:hypothetical protein
VGAKQVTLDVSELRHRLSLTPAPQNYQEYRNYSVTRARLPFSVIARSETTKQSLPLRAEIASLRSQ